jgi:hypothetical protein
MSAASDKIREMVDGYPDKIDSLNKSYQAITVLIDDLAEQKTALEDGVLSVIAIDEMKNTLLPAKTPNAYVRTFGNYGSYDAGGNVTDFEVYQLINNTATFTQDSPSGFIVEGVNITGLLSPGDEVVVTNNGVFSSPAITTTVQVTGAPYPAGSTLVIVDQPIIQATIDGVWKLVYEYLGTGWDSDPVIQGKIDAYAFTIDHIHAPLGTDGTYGIIDLKAALTQGRSIIYKNLLKTEGMEDTYTDFATPV